MEENKILEQGFDDPGRQVLKREIVHFTKAPEIQHFAEVKVSQNDNVYGVTWAEVVKNYLKTAYSGEDARAEVEAFGMTYKVLRRTGVTVFYDNDGNTLFDVTNERLADEYEWITRNPVSELEETEDEVVAVPMGTTSLAAIVTGNVPASTDEEVAEAIEQMNENLSEEDNGDVVAKDNEGSEEETPAEENGEVEKEVAQSELEEAGEVHTDVDGAVVENTQKSSVYIGVVGAVTKLQEELKKAKEKDFAKPVIEHLIERCKNSESLSSDVCQDHKTWEKCYKYIYDQARKQIKGSSGAVRDDVVYEWAEDYYHKDDKAEEEKKAKEAAERSKKHKEKEKKQKEDQKKRIERMKKRVAVKAGTEAKDSKTDATQKKKEVSKTKQESKPKRSNKDMDGQLDMFSFFGM